MKTLTEYVNEALSASLKDGGTMLERLKSKYKIPAYAWKNASRSQDDILAPLMDLDKLYSEYNKNIKSFKKIKFDKLNMHELIGDGEKFICLLLNEVEYTPSNIELLKQNIRNFAEQYTKDSVYKINIFETTNRFEDLKGEISIEIYFTRSTFINFIYRPEEFEYKKIS